MNDMTPAFSALDDYIEPALRAAPPTPQEGLPPRNPPRAAAAVPYIREQLDRMGVDVPLIGDFHYNGHTLLTSYPACAEALSKYRINPGNVGKGDKRDRQFGQMIEAALRWNKPVRIGVNWGSLDQELLAGLM